MPAKCREMSHAFGPAQWCGRVRGTGDRPSQASRLPAGALTGPRAPPCRPREAAVGVLAARMLSLQTHPRRQRAVAAPCGVLRCASAISAGRLGVRARFSPRPVLQDLPDHRRVEHERDDPHRRPADAAQRVDLENLGDEPSPRAAPLALRWHRAGRPAAGRARLLAGPGHPPRPRPPGAGGMRTVLPGEMESRRRDVLAQPRQHLQRVQRDAVLAAERIPPAAAVGGPASVIPQPLQGDRSVHQIAASRSRPSVS